MQNAVAIFVPSGVALLIAVGNGVWQTLRQRGEQIQRRKESIERMLQEKAEQYCLVSRNLMAKYHESLLAIAVGHKEMFLETNRHIEELKNGVWLLESFQMAFLRDAVGSTGTENSILVKEFNDFGNLLSSYKDEEIPQLIKAGVLKPYYDHLEQLVLENRIVVSGFVNQIAERNLLKLHEEWRKKHPIK